MCFSFGLNAQLMVNTNASPSALINSLIDPSVTVTNVTEDCDKNALNIGRGDFTFLGPGFNLNQGLLLTTGKALLALGPNLVGNAGLGSLLIGGGSSTDNDLQALVGNVNLYDLCKLEFDMVPAHDTLSITYSFGSEEYPEYAPPLDNSGMFNDVFGFFITGPGFNGTVNFAVIPGTTDRVCVNNINTINNPSLFNDNKFGVSLQYDGYTKNITSKVAVIPGRKYHIKLAIADVGDSYYDSGIFIQAGSVSALPVKFISLAGKRKNNGVQLEWSTASELNNKCMEVLRSNDGYTFTAIGKLPGHGTTYKFHTYSFLDRQAPEGTNYYRIRQVDDNGKETYSEIIQCQVWPTAFHLENLYPVPASDNLNISVSSINAENLHVDMTDLNGKPVREEVYKLEPGSNAISFNMTGLEKGVYFTRFYTDSFEGEYRRIVK